MKTQRPEVERSIDKLSQIDAVKRYRTIVVVVTMKRKR